MARLGKRERKELRERKEYEHAVHLAVCSRIDRAGNTYIRTSWPQMASDIIGKGSLAWGYDKEIARKTRGRKQAGFRIINK
jgi:hypothetical protein